MKSRLFTTSLSIVLAMLGINKASAQNDSIRVKSYAAMDERGIQVPYEFSRRPVGDHDVLVEILYCGICHSDVHEAFNDWGYTVYPNVSGHEMVGRVERIGKDVSRFKVGDYIGVGAVQSSCRRCEMCKSGKEQYCTHEGETGGNDTQPTCGFSSKTVVDEHYGIVIPKDAPIEKLGPIMCAGITVYSPLKAANLKKGDKVAIAGFGGLGHMAVQYAIAFGAEVTIFDRTEEKRSLAMEMGAAHYVNVVHPEEMEGWQGKFDYVLTTIPTHYDPVQYLNMLRTGGEMMIVGLPATSEAPDININAIPFGVHISKWLMGGIAETREVMDYSIKNKIYPMVEVIPVQQMNDAFQKVKDGEVHFRYVVDMKTLDND